MFYHPDNRYNLSVMRRIACIIFIMLLTWLASGMAWAETDTSVELPLPQRTFIPPKHLTLREAILLALRFNPNIQSGELQRVADKFALEVAKNQYVPQFVINGSATYASGSTASYNITPSVTWLTAPGATLSASYTNSLTGPGGSPSITLSATQHLLKGFGSQVTLTPLDQAYYTDAVSRLTLKNTAISTITTIIQNYYALVQAYGTLQINQLALESSQRTLAEYQTQVKAGREAAMEIVQQQSQIASQQLSVTQAKNAIQQAYQALLVNLGLDPNSKLEIDKNINLDLSKLPTLSQSQLLALQNNISYLQAIYSVKQAQANLILAKDQQKWTLDLTATQTITNGGTTETGTSSGGSVALNLNIPINNKSIQQQLVDAQISLQQQKIALNNTKLTVRSQVLAGLQSLQLQQQQVVQAEQAVKYAQLSLNVELIKLRYGRSSLFEVTQLRTNLTTAKLNLIQVQIGYILAVAEFDGLLGTTLDKWDVQLKY